MVLVTGHADTSVAITTQAITIVRAPAKDLTSVTPTPKVTLPRKRVPASARINPAIAPIPPSRRPRATKTRSTESAVLCVVEGRGSITAFYTVLVEGDDHNEPVADAVRAILDGHIVLSRDLAGRNHYPAIDILQSVSRTMPDVTTSDHRARAALVRDWLAMLRDNEDLVSVGAYAPGTNPRLDAALLKREAIQQFLCQSADTSGRLADAVAALQSL